MSPETEALDIFERVLRVRDMMVSCMKSEITITKDSLRFLTNCNCRGVVDRDIRLHTKKLNGLYAMVRNLEYKELLPDGGRSGSCSNASGAGSDTGAANTGSAAAAGSTTTASSAFLIW